MLPAGAAIALVWVNTAPESYYQITGPMGFLVTRCRDGAVLRTDHERGRGSDRRRRRAPSLASGRHAVDRVGRSDAGPAGALRWRWSPASTNRACWKAGRPCSRPTSRSATSWRASSSAGTRRSRSSCCWRSARTCWGSWRWRRPGPSPALDLGLAAVLMTGGGGAGGSAPRPARPEPVAIPDRRGRPLLGGALLSAASSPRLPWCRCCRSFRTRHAIEDSSSMRRPPRTTRSAGSSAGPVIPRKWCCCCSASSPPASHCRPWTGARSPCRSRRWSASLSGWCSASAWRARSGCTCRLGWDGAT